MSLKQEGENLDIFPYNLLIRLISAQHRAEEIHCITLSREMMLPERYRLSCAHNILTPLPTSPRF